MKLKKNTFIQGAFIATFGIVLSKILGIIYVIPFYSIIGDQGGALYGYAYNIYSIFLGISQAGVPLAMSRLISEYNTLGYFGDKEKIFRVGRRFLNIIGVLSFIILFVFARPIADLIIGGVSDGNTPEDIEFVIRMISTAILVVPILSVSRGYLQGHRFISPTSVSQVLEQVVRVVIIIVGSYVSYKVLGLPLKVAVGSALLAATIGALASYIYLRVKIKKNKKELSTESVCKEPDLSTMEIMKMIMIYAVPIILIELFRSIFNSVDVIMLVKTLVNDYSFVTRDAETVMSVVTTWGSKLNNIIVSVVSGLMTSLIPHLTRSIVKNDHSDINMKINQTFELILGIALPMAIGLSFLTTPVWNVFYGRSVYGPITYRYLVFIAFFTTIFSANMTITQLMKEYKVVIIGLIIGFVTKVSLNLPLMYLFNNLGIYPFYGAITASILGFLFASLFCIIVLIKKFKINFKPTLIVFKNIAIGILLMLLVMSIMTIIIPLDVDNRIVSALITAVYSLVGGSVYLSYVYFTHTLDEIFGKESVDKVKSKIMKLKFIK